MQAFISGFPQSPVEYRSFLSYHPPPTPLFFPAQLPLSVTSGIGPGREKMRGGEEKDSGEKERKKKKKELNKYANGQATCGGSAPFTTLSLDGKAAADVQRRPCDFHTSGENCCIMEGNFSAIRSRGLAARSYQVILLSCKTEDRRRHRVMNWLCMRLCLNSGQIHSRKWK